MTLGIADLLFQLGRYRANVGQLVRHRCVEVDAFKVLDELSMSPRQSCKPAACGELLQRHCLHGQRRETHLHQRLGAARAKREEFVCTHRRRQTDIVVEVAVPVGDVQLPPCKVAAAFLAIFLPGQHIETVDRVYGQIDRAATAQGLEALRGVKASYRDEGGQLFKAVKVVSFGFAAGVREAAFDGVDHEFCPFERMGSGCKRFRSLHKRNASDQIHWRIAI